MSDNPPPYGPTDPAWGVPPPPGQPGPPPPGQPGPPPYSGQPVGATPYGSALPGQPQPAYDPQGQVAFGPGSPGGPPGQPPYQQVHPPRRRGLTVVAVTAVLALLVAGGAFAFYKTDPFQLFSAGPQAAQALPADALVYLSVDADPSAKQKIDAVRFLNHFPYFKEHSGLVDENSDVRRSVMQKVLDAAGCSGVTYDDTVKPWLGQKFGVALMPRDESQTTNPVPVVAVEVTDEGQAKTGLGDLEACSEGSDETGFGFAVENGYALLAETQELAKRYADEASTSSLADNDAFNNDIASLGELGVATMWADVQGIVDSYGDTATDGLTPQSLGFLSSTSGRAAATFRFASDHVEIATSFHGDTTDITHSANQIVDLPESTVFAMSESGGADRLKASWDDLKNAMSSDGADVDKQLADFEAQTGFALPDDLETILGDNLMLSLDSEGLTTETLQAGDPALLNLGVRFTSDPSQLNSLYDKILALIQDQGGEDLSISKVDAADGMALASNDSYASTLSGLDGTLGDSDVFRSVISDAASKEFVLFFNWDAIEAQVTDALRSDTGSPQSQQIADNLTALSAMGVTAETDGDYTVSTFSISVND